MMKVYPKVVYGFDINKYYGFGDHWALCNFFLKKSEEIKEPVLVNRMGIDNSHKKDFNLIKNCLNSCGNFIKVDFPVNFVMDYCNTYKTDFCKTKICWSSKKSNLITYQLSGVFLNYYKDFTHQECKNFFRFLEPKHKLISVDNCEIHRAIDLMSKSKFFVGIPSGMALVACSVGVPSLIVCKIPDDNWFNMELHQNCIYYKKKNVTLFKTVNDLLNNIKIGII